MNPIENPQVLPASFFTGRPTTTIAADLLGKLLLYNSPAGQVGGYIVEAEAYLGTLDPGAHAFAGRHGKANDPLYGAPGTVYIYAIRGFYAFDVVTQAADEPQGILIRAIQPAIGEDLMLRNRPRGGFELTSGPGKLMQAFGIHDTAMNYQPLTESNLKICRDFAKTPATIQQGERIGVRIGKDWQDNFRYVVKGNPYVSKIRKRETDLENDGWLN
ncbi:DNA-3-methyladenine glycosylase [Lapidilactobacillus mulanensis]|uniref:Putative 3-methyladenine DNA glycosylase n=1 Tax=Lapidilactobacillus mulanensis TaxID=2485999 RepID=A0ABW4DMK2_9LACO|nr:DNA-3-methyladenine glycosylase [Lapidilactobacillus mulanensis]